MQAPTSKSPLALYSMHAGMAEMICRGAANKGSWEQALAVYITNI
jgi:hypothetical protein